MIEFFALFILGVFLLVKSSDLFVVSASRLAKIFGVSELVIGLTIVSVGTSLPEFASGLVASWNNNPGIVIGNIIGSNISNLALVLGISAIFHTLKIEKRLFERECYVLMGTTILFYILLSDFIISFSDSLLLIFLFLAYIFFMFRFRMQFKELFKVKLYTEHLSNFRHFLHLVKENFKKILIGETLVFLISIAGLYFGANFVLDSALNIAGFFGLTETFVGLTLIALGTSLPELVVSIISLNKGFHNMLIGNIVGSNILNILFVGGFSSLVSPLIVSEYTIFLLGPFLLILTAIFLLFAWSDLQIKKSEGIALILLYLFFLVMVLPKGA